MINIFRKKKLSQSNDMITNFENPKKPVNASKKKGKEPHLTHKNVIEASSFFFNFENNILDLAFVQDEIN